VTVSRVLRLSRDFQSPIAQHHRVGALVAECYFVYSFFGAEGMRSQNKTNDSGSGRGTEFVWEPVPGSSDVAQEQRVESGHPKRTLELFSPSSFLLSNSMVSLFFLPCQALLLSNEVKRKCTAA